MPTLRLLPCCLWLLPARLCCLLSFGYTWTQFAFSTLLHGCFWLSRIALAVTCLYLAEFKLFSADWCLFPAYAWLCPRVFVTLLLLARFIVSASFHLLACLANAVASLILAIVPSFGCYFNDIGYRLSGSVSWPSLALWLYDICCLINLAIASPVMLLE